MISNVDLFFIEDEENQQNNNLKLIRKYLRDHSNIFDLENEKFVSYFRLNKEAVLEILQEIKGKARQGKNTNSIPDIIKLAACLRFFAEGGYQKGVGNDYSIGLGQSTFSEILAEYLHVLESTICQKWIKFEKTPEEERKCKNAFYTNYGFPGVTGCVDGTHIKIIAPRKDIRHLYYCRKGFYSINAMVVCDEDMVIRFVDGRHPGANHDSFIFNNSEICNILKENYENGSENSWLLGDAGYPLLPFLMTPFRTAPSQSPQSFYNKTHIKARNIMERTIGLLKSRFRCILGARELYYSPDKVTKIINVVCTLHNICCFYKIDLQQLEDVPDFNVDVIDTELEEQQHSVRNAMQERAEVTRNLIMMSLN